MKTAPQFTAFLNSTKTIDDAWFELGKNQRDSIEYSSLIDIKRTGTSRDRLVLVTGETVYYSQVDKRWICLGKLDPEMLSVEVALLRQEVKELRAIIEGGKI